jgi:hypothetical protein
MVWNPSLSEFVLSRICELVDRRLNLSRGFKECYLKSVCNDVKDFTHITVTPCQVYNHMRKWKAKWMTVCKLKKLLGVTFDSTSCAIMVDKEEFKQLIMVSLHITSLINMFKLLWFTQLTKSHPNVRNSRRMSSC